MPIIKIATSSLSKEIKQKISLELVEMCATTLKKAKESIMVTFSEEWLYFQGNGGHSSALVEVTSIGGLTQKNNDALAKQISVILTHHLSLSPDSLHTVFNDYSSDRIALGSTTFASK